MTAGSVLFLAANTMRSRAYAQAMVRATLGLEHCLILSQTGAGPVMPPVLSGNQSPESTGLELPDLSIPLEQSCKVICDDVQLMEATGVNDEQVVHHVRSHPSDLIVFSGFGGEIVGSGILGLGAPVLHIHGGWVPDYRGSTTNYYSLIERGDFGVSAILLSDQLDGGPVVARRRYPAPVPGVNIDYLYDNAIRADMLVHVLSAWRQTGQWASESLQSDHDARMFYVIHPVLKHLAIMSLGQYAAGSDNA